jgi:hypothetical protein
VPDKSYLAGKVPFGRLNFFGFGVYQKDLRITSGLAFTLTHAIPSPDGRFLAKFHCRNVAEQNVNGWNELMGINWTADVEANCRDVSCDSHGGSVCGGSGRGQLRWNGAKSVLRWDDKR